MGYDDRKRQEKEIRRKDIVDAAERIFFTKGYENTSVDEIAKEAEFSKRTVYVYFNSKEQIYFEIMIRGYRLLIEMIEDGLKKSPPSNALDELSSIFFTFFDFSRNHPKYFKAIMEYETKEPESSGVGDESKAECYKLGEQIFGYLLHALQKGAAEGTFLKGFDMEQVALTLWACTVGVYNTGDRKAGYLEKYHHVDSNDFIKESFLFITRLISRKKGDQHD